MIKRIIISSSVFLCLTLSSQSVTAQSPKLSFIRDAEIEHTLRSYATPLFSAADLNPNDISIHIVNNRVINAFVAGGQRMFFYTGLLERVENPSQLKGVIAHETGHIAGSHLARTQAALANATTKSIIGYILGAAAVFAGGGKGGAAVVGGAQTLAAKSFLKYSREQESAADQASLKYLERTGTSGRGIMEFLKILNESEQVSYGKIDPYWRTHPIGSDRIAAMEQRILNSPYRDVPDSKIEIQALKRIQAKLFGFTRGLKKTLKQYPLEDQSQYARYARAIAYFKFPDVEKGLIEIDSLISEFPNNPYFYELKGQMLYENGNIYEALPALEIAAAIMPYEPLIQTLYGTALVATEERSNLELAIKILKNSAANDPNMVTTWNQLAIAYNRVGDTGNLALATAERFMLQRKYQKAIFHAKRAQEFMANGTPGFLRADDIISLSQNRIKK